MKLSDFAADTFSQFGEDGEIAHALERMGIESRFCVEFGAADGVALSNTKALRDQGWLALLIESDIGLYEKLCANAPEAECHHRTVTGEVVDSLVAGRPVDVMSIDVDGDDWFIFRDMHTRPRLVVIEFNCSIPPGLVVRASNPGGRFGASIAAMIQLANDKGYALIGLNHTNAFFVPYELLHYFDDLEKDPAVLMADRRYSIVATDYDGRLAILTRDSFWWGFAGYCQPCTETLVFQDNAFGEPR